MATWDNINPTQNERQDDTYIVYQNGINYLQTLQTLSAAVDQGEWTNTFDYSVNDVTRGNDGKRYIATQASGPNNGGSVDPVGGGAYWYDCTDVLNLRQATATEVENREDVKAYVKPSQLPDTFDIEGLPQKDVVVDEDLFGISDSEDVFNNKKIDFFTIAKALGLAGSYGVTWDSSADTYQRIGQKNNTLIQSKMKRCVLNPDGSVNYYLNSNNSNYKYDGTASDLSGTDGNVMVEIPKFYYKYTELGTSKTIEISEINEEGFDLHPAFIKNGVEVDYRYYRAYEGYYDGTALRSISGVTPTRSQNINTFRSYAESNGSGWHLTDWQLLHAVQILYFTEFADFNSQSILGNGNSTGSDYGVTTGNSNSLGNNSSSAPNDAWMSYRGIENFYGDIWEFIDGINIRNREVWISNDHTSFSSDLFDGNVYNNSGISVPVASADYTKDINFSAKGFIPLSTGASSSTYVTDGVWSNTGDKVCRFGGDANDGALCGAFCVSLDNSSASSSVASGAAVAF